METVKPIQEKKEREIGFELFYNMSSFFWAWRGFIQYDNRV